MTDPDEFLLAFHAAHPGCTTHAFADATTKAGRSSYDVLADAALAGPGDESGLGCGHGSGDGRILDLGCGDGYLLQRMLDRGVAAARLAGVDMSADELALASQRRSSGRAALIQARAQALPFSDSSVSALVSHLAFMLMSDIDGVVREIARVLAPGGVFATIIGGGPQVGSAFELFLDELQPLYASGPPIPGLGDRRMRSDSGIAELLGPIGSPMHIRDFHVHLSGPFEHIWTCLSTVYEMHSLSAQASAHLRQRFHERVSPLTRADGTIPCSMAMRLVHGRRRDHRKSTSNPDI